jgi:hypothetical protein
MPRIRQGQRKDGECVFTPHMQGLSARHQQLQMRTGSQQVHQARRCFSHPLEVVQQYQAVLFTKHHLQVLEWWQRSRFLQSERLHQGGKDQVGILKGGQ